MFRMLSYSSQSTNMFRKLIHSPEFNFQSNPPQYMWIDANPITSKQGLKEFPKLARTLVVLIHMSQVIP